MKDLRRLLALTAVAVTLTACGTTVPQATQVSIGQRAGASGGSAVEGPASGPEDTTIADGAAPSATGTATPGAPGVIAAPTAPGVAGAGGGSVAGSPAPSAAATTVTTAKGKPAEAKTTARATAGKTTAAKASAAASASATTSGNKAPLSIGFAYQDNSSADSSLGSNVGAATLNRLTAAQAIVKAINASGGFGGRQLTLIPDKFNTSDSNYDSDATAGCQMFTQDQPVSVVIDLAFGTIGGFAQCLQKAGVADIGSFETDTATTDSLSLSIGTLEMSIDHAYASVINGELAGGYLTKKNKIGIILEDCTDTTAAYNDTIAPLIRKLGLDLADTEHFGCTTGYDSAATDAATASNAEVSFVAQGVDRVMIMSTFEDIGLLLFSNIANSQGYKPGYLLSSNAEAASLISDWPAGQVTQFHGIGHVLTFDSNDSKFPQTASEATCNQLITAGQATISTYGDHFYAYVACGPLLLLKAALTADGGNANGQAVVNAIAAAGSFDNPGLVGGGSSFATRHDGPNEVQAFAYNTTCSCFSYTGSPFASS